ncbi:MAG: DUF2027 domain-containing protein [Bacteroidota bacterium]
MLFKIGDKVKFLNQKGGGVVSKIISPALVNVAIESGFEIPTLASDLILIQPTSFSQKFFKEDFNVTLPKHEEDDDSGETPERISPLVNIAGKKTLARGVYLVFLPHNQKWLITGKLDLYIVNHTDYDLMYAYFLREEDGSFTGMDNDSIPPASKIYLQTIEREEINAWNRGILQVLFYKETNKKVLLPVSSSFDAKGSRFVKEENYTDMNVLDGKALIVTIGELSKQAALDKTDLDPKYGHLESTSSGAEIYHEAPLIDKHRTAANEAEVDLHIEELIEDSHTLDTAHILNIQLDYFSRALESALSNGYRKVIFIHGVGSGTLKSEIKMILDGYKGLEHRQASMAKYGVGAIEVNIFHNR